MHHASVHKHNCRIWRESKHTNVRVVPFSVHCLVSHRQWCDNDVCFYFHIAIIDVCLVYLTFISFAITNFNALLAIHPSNAIPFDTVNCIVKFERSSVVSIIIDAMPLRLRLFPSCVGIACHWCSQFQYKISVYAFSGLRIQNQFNSLSVFSCIVVLLLRLTVMLKIAHRTQCHPTLAKHRERIGSILNSKWRSEHQNFYVSGTRHFTIKTRMGDKRTIRYTLIIIRGLSWWLKLAIRAVKWSKSPKIVSRHFHFFSKLVWRHSAIVLRRQQ